MSLAAAALRDELLASRRLPGLNEWLDTQDPEVVEVVTELAADTTIPHAKFTEILTRYGCRAHKDTVTKWRKQHGFPG